MNSQRILTTSIICLLTICSLSQAVVQAQNSRAATAASYLERGNEWMANGEWDRAIDDYDLAIAFDSHAAKRSRINSAVKCSGYENAHEIC